MKKGILTIVAVIFVVFIANLANADIVDRARRSLDKTEPDFGAPKVEDIIFLWGDEKEPYKLCFAIKLNQAGRIWTQWSKEKTNEVVMNGMEIHKMDDYNYVYLVTLDLQEVKRITGNFGTPINLAIGTESVTGFPSNVKIIEIHRKADIPKEEWHQYFEATPLEVIIRGKVDKKYSSAPPTK